MSAEICKHQESRIALHLRKAKELGRKLGLKRKEQVECGLMTIAAIDSTPEEEAEWSQAFIKILFHTDDVPVRCPDCGHVAGGHLVPDEDDPVLDAFYSAGNKG
ncbi:MAG: hypothetical protein C5B56_08485 [Proteobacteria bacterium]|nr:MAG: hypothetical protein C5B56_08485 [Pseudomonadota bacterium]